MLKDDLGRLPHLNLKIYAAIFTSICLVLRKPAAVSSSSKPAAERLAAIDIVLAAARSVRPEELLPKRSVPRRAVARLAQALRGARYRCEEWFLDYAKY